MKKNLLSRLEKTLRQVEECRCCYKSWCCHLGVPPRHPEFISGSQESKEMPNPVQHDGRNDSHPETHPRHPEFISGSQEGKEMMKQVPHDDCVGWCGISLSLGRSMIEMLGVLAIIGVLSIGGLYTYRQAMTRYRVNQIFSFLQQITDVMADKCIFNKRFPDTWIGPSSEKNTIKNDICLLVDNEYCADKKSWSVWRVYSSRDWISIVFAVSKAECLYLTSRYYGGMTFKLAGAFPDAWETDHFISVKNGYLTDQEKARAFCEDQNEKTFTFYFENGCKD